jgi:hypothetical protein
VEARTLHHKKYWTVVICLAKPWLDVVINNGAKRHDVKKSNCKETRDLTWKTPQHEREKLRSPTSKHFIVVGVRLPTPTTAAYKKQNESVCSGKP